MLLSTLIRCSTFQRTRLPRSLRRYGGIICDVVYDYFLARHWGQFAKDDFEEFCSTAYQQILVSKDQLPVNALSAVIRMQENSSLENYGTKQYIERSLFYIGQRLKRENPLHLAFDQFEKFEAEIEQDFMGFIPEVDEYGQQWLHTNAPDLLSAEPQKY